MFSTIASSLVQFTFNSITTKSFIACGMFGEPQWPCCEGRWRARKAEQARQWWSCCCLQSPPLAPSRTTADPTICMTRLLEPVPPSASKKVPPDPATPISLSHVTFLPYKNETIRLQIIMFKTHSRASKSAHYQSSITILHKILQKKYSRTAEVLYLVLLIPQSSIYSFHVSFRVSCNVSLHLVATELKLVTPVSVSCFF